MLKHYPARGIMKQKALMMFGYFLLTACMFVAVPVQAGGLLAFTLIAENGRFKPEVITVPAHTRFKLLVTNHGPGPEEFESRELRKETVLAAGVTRAVVFAPLKPGIYRFFGDFHPGTARGRIVVK